MAKKGSIAKLFVGITALAVGGKVAYDKYKIVKEKFEKEENESLYDEVKKYNAVCTSKTIEVEEEDFQGCELKAIASKLIVDLSLAQFQKDEYINFKSDGSFVKIILPEGVNVTCDIENVASGIKNLVANVEESGIPTVFIIGKSTLSNLEIIPANFYSDEDDFEDEDEDEEDNTAEDVKVKPHFAEESDFEQEDKKEEADVVKASENEKSETTTEE